MISAAVKFPNFRARHRLDARTHLRHERNFSEGYKAMAVEEFRDREATE
jgi:hypothetical protein